MVQFKAAKHTTKGILDYVHTNVWGPTRDSSLSGSHYFVISLMIFLTRLGCTS